MIQHIIFVLQLFISRARKQKQNSSHYSLTVRAKRAKQYKDRGASNDLSMAKRVDHRFNSAI